MSGKNILTIALSMHRSKVAKKILEALDSVITQNELARALSMPQCQISSYLNKLLKIGIIKVNRIDIKTKHYVKTGIQTKSLIIENIKYI